ncbi:MAG: DUF1704 domain-containing protein [Polyangiaceae bacterium]|nr:DUF1704 domain-containing protein [Polyangiaceae bacterium]
MGFFAKPTMDPATLKLLERARLALAGSSGLLDALAWPRSVEQAFLASHAQQIPEPVYAIDRVAVEARLARLDSFDEELRGDDALVRLLRARTESQRLGARMLLALGTKAFSDLSAQVYGSARSTWLDGDTSNLDFAEHLLQRIGVTELAARGRSDDELDAEGLAAYVRERISKRKHKPKLEILIDPELSAKAIAGKTRLRIRGDATFDDEEARSLYLHEIETHVFTAQNGDAQPHLDFLGAGGPLTTRTQEGLAVFVELYSQALTIGRLRRLVERVRLVAMAEDGASFVDLYRHLVSLGADERAAFLDVARICRGGLCGGGAPFTKDACYLSGLVEVYDFLRLAVSHQGLLVAEVLVSGRLALSELEALVALREQGLLAPPVFVPSWLRRWDDLLAHFAFTSFLSEIDLAFVAQRHAWLARLPLRTLEPAATPASPTE